jgi:hypothetical protein
VKKGGEFSELGVGNHWGALSYNQSQYTERFVFCDNAFVGKAD